MSLGSSKLRAFDRVAGDQAGLDHAFVNFVLTETRPKCFVRQCGPAPCNWDGLLPDDTLAAYPLWSSLGDPTFMLHRTGGISFAVGSCDFADVYHVAYTAQGLLAEVFFELWDERHSLAALRAAARYSGFQFLDEVEALQACRSDSHRHWWQIKRKFVEDVDRRVLGRPLHTQRRVEQKHA